MTILWLLLLAVALSETTVPMQTVTSGELHFQLRAFEAGGSRVAQLVVADKNGKELWVGPKEVKDPAYPQEPFIFGGDFDRSSLECAGDMDGDGHVELIGTFPKSDVRATRFRIFRWVGGELKHLRSGELVQSESRPRWFLWEGATGHHTWVESIKTIGADGQCLVEVGNLFGGPSQSQGRFSPEGFEKDLF